MSIDAYADLDCGTCIVANLVRQPWSCLAVAGVHVDILVVTVELARAEFVYPVSREVCGSSVPILDFQGNFLKLFEDHLT